MNDTVQALRPTSMVVAVAMACNAQPPPVLVAGTHNGRQRHGVIPFHDYVRSLFRHRIENDGGRWPE